MNQKKIRKKISPIGILVLAVLFSASLVAKVAIINHTDTYSKIAPAGSFESLKFSVDNNIDYDLDVQLSKDGELVLSHDSVSNYTWSELKEKRIAAADYTGEYPDATYIRLADVLYYVQSRNSSIKLYIDVKAFSTYSNGALQKTLDMVNRYGLFDNVYFWVRSIGQKNSAKELRYGEKAHYALWVSYDVNLALEASTPNNRDGIDLIGFRYSSSYDGGYSCDDIIDILHDRGIKVSMYGVPKSNSFINTHTNIDYISDSRPETFLYFDYFKSEQFEPNDVQNVYEIEPEVENEIEEEIGVELIEKINSRRVELGNEVDMQTLFTLDSSLTFSTDIKYAGDYNLTFRLRGDYQENRFNYNYKVEIDGVEIDGFTKELTSMEVDRSGILRDDWYWGKYKGENISLSEGIHYIKIIPLNLWSGVDYLTIEKVR